MSKESNYSKFTRIAVETFVVILFSVVFVLQNYNIIGRYTKIWRPLMWVQDFSIYSFIWMIFLLWFLLDRRGSHFVVNMLSDKLSEKNKKYQKLFVNLIAVFFSGVVIQSSFKLIPIAMTCYTSSFTWLPKGVVYMVMPLGLLLVLVERLRLMYKISKQHKHIREDDTRCIL